jgi:DNA mismatch repair protein MutL
MRMGSIVLLDDLTINKIAAGEVIERPANVVKELVENSIDAGATAISVDIENGGISYIRITDNGKGIEPDDVDLAFERHATSKIRSADDLTKVSTMGFRGEALASVAAISKVEMVTKTKNSDIGTRINVESGKVILKEECGAPLGTTITIRELFFNTPVRYKFLKKDFTEGGYIEDTLSKIALINPNISFRVTNNKKEVLQTSGNGDMSAVVYNVFGKDIATNLLDVEFEYEGMKISGVVGKPEIARSNRANQIFYVNKRFIKDKILMAAAEEAYRTVIPQGKFGFCILNLQINPELVDVNVHPAKLEVRFSDESLVFKAMNHSIKDALSRRDVSAQKTEETKNIQDDEVTNEQQHKKGLFDIFRNLEYKPKQVTSNVIPLREEKNIFANQEEQSDEINENINSEKTEEVEIEAEELNEPVKKFINIEIEDKPVVPEYKIIGTAFSTYILLELEDDVYILDQHAAHERVLYERTKFNFYKDGGKEVQMLLLPDVITLSKRDMNIVRDHIDLFEQTGFTLEEFGENTIKITGVPVMCFDMDTKDLFLDILDGMELTNRTNKQDVEEKFIATVACKAAIKANMSLETNEIESLLNDLLVLENPFTCPHGRPTAIRITKNEIEKKFGRR